MLAHLYQTSPLLLGESHLRATRFGSWGLIAAGGQSGVTNFVEQGAVADVQRAGSRFAVPVVVLQDTQNDLPLHLMHSFAGELFQ